jgi:hypothetical protein
MRFQGALLREQGVEFGIVIVKQHVLANRFEAQRTMQGAAGIFGGGIAVVLMAQDYRGVPQYFGRSDIVRFLSHIPVSAIPWQECAYN